MHKSNQEHRQEYKAAEERYGGEIGMVDVCEGIRHVAWKLERLMVDMT